MTDTLRRVLLYLCLAVLAYVVAGYISLRRFPVRDIVNTRLYTNLYALRLGFIGLGLILLILAIATLSPNLRLRGALLTLDFLLCLGGFVFFAYLIYLDEAPVIQSICFRCVAPAVLITLLGIAYGIRRCSTPPIRRAPSRTTRAPHAMNDTLIRSVLLTPECPEGGFLLLGTPEESTPNGGAGGSIALCPISTHEGGHPMSWRGRLRAAWRCLRSRYARSSLSIGSPQSAALLAKAICYVATQVWPPNSMWRNRIPNTPLSIRTDGEAQRNAPQAAAAADTVCSSALAAVTAELLKRDQIAQRAAALLGGTTLNLDEMAEIVVGQRELLRTQLASAENRLTAEAATREALREEIARLTAQVTPPAETTIPAVGPHPSDEKPAHTS